MANGGAWGVRNRGAGTYNPDCDFCDNCYEHGHEAEDCPNPDMTEEHLRERRERNLKEYGANTVTQVNSWGQKYLFCDSIGDTRPLGYFESLFYQWGWKKAEDFK